MKITKPTRPVPSMNAAAPSVTPMLMMAITRNARSPTKFSKPVIARWPPSSGSTGIRFSMPIAGPAHQMAAAASDQPTPS